MDLFKQGMKVPTRPAPTIPGLVVNRYSPVTNWNDDPFVADVFEPAPTQKKKPPPRPPPPKLNTRLPDVPAKPSHFMRKPTVLTSLLTRKNKNTVNNSCASNTQSILADFNSEVNSLKIFPKCEPKNVQTASLIDLSSPPSSPTLTTRSSSDGLSVDSFGSDATTSTHHHNTFSGGNTSQAESGFEDDFDLILNSRKICKEDTLCDFAAIDPFSPPPNLNKPPVLKKPVLDKDLLDLSSIKTHQTMPSLKKPTIIRAKPARPKPPDNAAILKSTFGNSLPITTMNVNTTVPIQKINNIYSDSFGDNFDSKPFSFCSPSEERESSPPMPSIPPPPPPVLDDEDVPLAWPEDEVDLATCDLDDDEEEEEEEEPYAVALFDYFTDHPDDLCFSANTRIKLIRRVDSEWLYGSVRGGAEGVFPSNYVEVKVPLANEPPPSPPLGTATALYDFEPVQPGDLGFRAGDAIAVLSKLNEEWYFGTCNGAKGQFPVNYVQMC